MNRSAGHTSSWFRKGFLAPQGSFQLQASESPLLFDGFIPPTGHSAPMPIPVYQVLHVAGVIFLTAITFPIGLLQKVDRLVIILGW